MSTAEAGGSLDAAYFAAKYGASPDPWQLADSWYERRKYACTTALLPKARYHNGFEPGCSIGILSSSLARRCDQLLCWDIDPRAVETTRRRLAGELGATVEADTVPGSWPTATFDLIVVSELAYYLCATDRHALWTATAASLERGGTLVAVHWRPESADHCCDGDAVHAELRTDPRFRPLGCYCERDFVIDVLTTYTRDDG